MMVELDQEINEDIMNDDGATSKQILPVPPPDSAVLTEITKRLTRYNTALRTCNDNKEDQGNMVQQVI